MASQLDEQGYSALVNRTSHDFLTESFLEKDSNDSLLPNTKRSIASKIWSATAITVLVVTCVTVFFLGLRWQLNLDLMCSERRLQYSPVWEDVSPARKVLKLNGSLDAASPYRGPPSDVVDKAWNRFASVGLFPLSDEKFLRAGGNTDNLRMPDEFGGGFLADVELFHQMHCLNFLRKAAYSDYYSTRGDEWADSEQTFNVHIDHCIERLRITIMCQADASIIGTKWVDGYDRPFPDFANERKCGDYEGILSWVHEREAPIPEGYRWTPQPGEKIFERPWWMPKKSPGQGRVHAHPHDG